MPPSCFWLRVTVVVPPAWVTVYRAAAVLPELAGQRTRSRQLPALGIVGGQVKLSVGAAEPG